MPHARVDMHRSLQPMMADISAAILRGMVTGFEMPADDLFQIFRLHDTGELVFSPTFPDHDRDDIVFIDLLANVGYSDEVKQRTMAAIADEVSALGIRRENLLLVVNDVHGASNWYAAGPPEAAAS